MIVKKNSLGVQKGSLQKRERELEQKLLELELQKNAQQRDVEQLEGRSLTILFYRLFGKHQQFAGQRGCRLR